MSVLVSGWRRIVQGGAWARGAVLMAAAVCALQGAPAQAATTVSADWDAGCGPSDCFSHGTYTHTWAAGAFDGPVTIDRLLLARGILGDLAGQVFRLSFQLNGQEVGSWGDFMMGEIGGDELGFGGDSFTWDPADGDLTLVLDIDWSLAAGWSNRAVERDLPPDGGAGGDGLPQLPADGGDPSETPSAAVPEPDVWTLLIGGFGMAGAALRRRGAALARVAARR